MESLSKLVNNNIIPPNLSKTQSFKFNPSTVSAQSSIRSSSISTSSNRTNSCDYDFDPEADADTDFSNEFSNFLNKKSSPIEKPNVQQLFLNNIPKTNIERRISNDLSNKSSPNTSMASITFSSKIKSSSHLSIDHGKI